MRRSARATFSPAVRREVKAKGGGVCGICGCPLLEPNQFAIDHIVPHAGGGPDSIDNLQPAHERCNAMKSARDLPDWHTTSIATTPHRAGTKLYDLAFPAPRYVEAMRRNGSNPFVRVDEAPDHGSYIGRMYQGQISELLSHGACLTDEAGNDVGEGRLAHFFIWPHVASRGSRYNCGVYSLICPAKADLARFGQNRAKGETETLRRVKQAAELWLKRDGCQWACDVARTSLAESAYAPAGL